jgi:hypothetical protein
MKTISILLIFASLVLSSPGCVATTCNKFSYQNPICYKNRTEGGVFYVDFYSKIENGIAVWCPDTQHTYCNDFIGYADLNDTAPCSPLKPTGAACISPYQCAAALCVLGKCAGAQNLLSGQCKTNSDCVYSLSCINMKCSKPLQLNQPCSHSTQIDFYGFEMDHNECDYTKNLICGYSSNSTAAQSTCMPLFSVVTNIYVTNPLLCKTMVTTNGWLPGYCVTDRVQYMYALTSLDAGKLYKSCNTDSDCVYNLNQSGQFTYNGSCQCSLFDANAQKYCNFGGGEPLIVNAVSYYQTHWITQFNTIYNSHGIKYIYALDNYLRNQLNNPAYCSIAAFYNNMSLEPTNSKNSWIYYIVAGVLCLIGFAGFLIVVLTC